MINKIFHDRSAFAQLALAGLFAAGVCTIASAEEPVAAQVPDGKAVLVKMARFLAAQDRFSVEIVGGYDTVQPNGMKVEFLENRSLLVDRPGRLRVDLEQSDGGKSRVVIDGKTITAQDLDANVYAQTEAKASLDESVRFFVGGLRMRFPLAVMLLASFPEELDRRLVDVAYVERTSILGEPTDHVVGSTDTVDFQVWVAAKGDPLPKRIVLTYPEAEGQPQFRAFFHDWDLSPRVRDAMFEFEAPKGASKILFVNQVPQPAAVVAPAAAEGEQR